MMRKRAILMCAGEYEQMEIPCTAGDLVVAVDGGLGRLLEQKIEPDLVLGDFDSLGAEYRSYLEMLEKEQPERLRRLPCEKDDTDTLYACRVCQERGCREILIYGGLGGRLDHTLANIQTLAWLIEQGTAGYLLGKKTLVTVLDGEEMKLPEGFSGTFSLFALDTEVSGVTLEGMKYPLYDAAMTNAFPLGVSNEVHSTQRACLRVRTGKAVVLLESGQGEIRVSSIERSPV